MVASWAIHFSNFVRVVTCWIHGNYFIYCFWMIGFPSWSWTWFQHDQGLSFDSRSVDQVKKNQNWLLDGMKYFLCSNQFGSCKGNVTWIFILRLITWPKVLWWCKFCFHRCHPPLSSSQLILILGFNLGLIPTKHFQFFQRIHKHVLQGYVQHKMFCELILKSYELMNPLQFCSFKIFKSSWIIRFVASFESKGNKKKFCLTLLVKLKKISLGSTFIWKPEQYKSFAILYC